MTPPPTYRGRAFIAAELRRLGRRRRRVATATGLCATATTVCSAILIITAAAGYWQQQPPTALRWTLLILASAATAATVATAPLRALLQRRNAFQNARYAEERIDRLDNELINALQLSSDTTAPRPLVQAAIHETAAKLRRIDLAATVPTRRLRWLARTAAILAIAVLAVGLFQGPHLRRALTAAFRPNAYAPTIGTVEVLSVSPGDTSVYRGHPTTITATIRNNENRRLTGELILTDAAHPSGVVRAMTPGADGQTFTLPLGPVTDTLRYHLQIGDTRIPADKPDFTIAVVDTPGLAGLDVKYSYPAYTSLNDKTLRNIPGPLRAPVGATATLTIGLQRPAGGVLLMIEGRPTAPMIGSDKGLRFTAEFPILADGAYSLSLCDTDGRIIQRLPDGEGEGAFPIEAIPDSVPTVMFRRPHGRTTVAPGDSLPVAIRATDDYGVASATIFLGEPHASRKAIRRFTMEAPKKAAELTHALMIPADTPIGTVLLCSATVADNRPDGAQTAETADAVEILVQHAQAARATAETRFAELQALLEQLLAAQVRAKLATLLARDRSTNLESFASRANAVATGQKTLRERTRKIVQTFPFPASMTPAKTALAMLADDEMTLAVDQAAILAALDDLNRRAQPCTLLLHTQERIIEDLQTLLAYLPGMAGRGEEAATGGGGDLKTDHVEKLRDLAADLTKLADEHARVIAAARQLAKTPVDQFTPDDERLLHDLRAMEDRWEKFLDEAFADFSKLTRQDFSNPSLLAEVLSIRCDVTMAKDALSTPAAEIATATNAMTSAGENAEELTANIEKWLPDTPDRQQWVMEDPGGADNVEAPELPSELEDLVGDLLEQEEDLFEQMQDVTSQAADSFDKGVGWAAMDGPISSMNAQGVTGNMPPNSSEISGRAGEGRQGKSSGEFVQDTFVGKGGRRTPTRLTPEPFSAGQVKDTSSEPAGGATGGGKIGGAGGEGLEGPTPPPLAENLQRLASRQAHLINKAERLGERFAVDDYSGFQLRRAVMLMNRVRDDLEHHRYRNALRRREVILDALDGSRRALSVPTTVLRDTTAAAPKHIRRDIDQARRSRLPDPYRAILQSYLHKLAGER